jgi:hypothetical protein
MLLLAPQRREARIGGILGMCTHVELASDAEFLDIFAESMALERFQLR